MKSSLLALIILGWLTPVITTVFADDDGDLVFNYENNNESLDIEDFVFVDANHLENEVNQLPSNEFEQEEDEVKNEVIDLSSVGYATCRGLITYGGKTFAVWLAGSNPATATVLIVGIVGSQIAGYGFDKVSDYLRSQDITPPPPLTPEEIEALIDEFILLPGLDEEIAPEDDEILDIVNDFELVDRPELTHLQQIGRYAQGTYYRGAEIATNFIGGLPRMSATMIPGTLAGMIAQMVSGNIGAALANAAVNDLAGQVYDANITVIPEETVRGGNPPSSDDDDNVEPIIEANENFHNVVILDNYMEPEIQNQEEDLNLNRLLNPTTASSLQLFGLFNW